MATLQQLAQARLGMGLKADTASDQIWQKRISSGTHNIQDALKAMGTKVAGTYGGGVAQGQQNPWLRNPSAQPSQNQATFTTPGFRSPQAPAQNNQTSENRNFQRQYVYDPNVGYFFNPDQQNNPEIYYVDPRQLFGNDVGFTVQPGFGQNYAGQSWTQPGIGGPQGSRPGYQDFGQNLMQPFDWSSYTPTSLPPLHISPSGNRLNQYTRPDQLSADQAQLARAHGYNVQFNPQTRKYEIPTDTTTGNLMRTGQQMSPEQYYSQMQQPVSTPAFDDTPYDPWSVYLAIIRRLQGESI